MKKLVGTLLALVMVLGLMTAAAEPLELTMYFPVNVGGSAAALIDAMTHPFCVIYTANEGRGWS